MRFIRHALIGIALYEAVKYILRNRVCGFDFSCEGRQSVSNDQSQQIKENAAFSEALPNYSAGLAGRPDLTDPGSGDDLSAGSDPEAPLTRRTDDQADPWKKSLANDELRAPDS